MAENLTMQEYIDEAESELLHTYNRYQIVLDKGDGVYLYDYNGKKYLDFVSGIAVFALGYHNESYNNALKEQIDKLIHTSNYYYNVPAIEAAKKLKAVSGMDRVFFTNSGAEAIEGAIKAARKYAYLKDGTTDHEIIAMEHSFHGRTMGALSVTGNPHYREAFEPGIGNIRFATMNDIDSVKALINEKTCAIIMETVQGEGGIHPADEAFLRELRKICDEKDILLILDEIQCGMGRTGYMFAWQKYGVKPDIMTTAKALGGGFPIGALLATEACASVMTVGTHGTTYGGNPLAGAVAGELLSIVNTPEVLSGVRQRHQWFCERLQAINARYGLFKEIRGLGLLLGCVLNDAWAGKAKTLSNLAAEEGVMILIAGANVVRFAPALNVSEEEVNSGLDRVERACARFVAGVSS